MSISRQTIASSINAISLKAVSQSAVSFSGVNIDVQPNPFSKDFSADFGYGLPVRRTFNGVVI